jgi:site-specific DNA recombinase
MGYLLEDVFEAHNTAFKAVIEPFDTTTAQGKAFLGMLAVFAQLERDTISERTKDALQYKRETGEWCGRIPFGFRVDNGCLVEDPDQIKLIRQAKRMRDKGLSLREIATRANLSLGYLHKVLNTNLRTIKANYINRKANNAVHKTSVL